MVPKGFEYQLEKLSVLTVDGDPMKGEKASANKSEGYKIYAKKNVSAGPVEFEVTAGKSYILFVKVFAPSKSVTSCGGDEQLLNIAHPEFNTCSFPEDNTDDCKTVFAEGFDGKEGWNLPPNTALESWVKVGFKNNFQLSNVVIRPRENETNNI